MSFVEKRTGTRGQTKYLYPFTAHEAHEVSTSEMAIPPRWLRGKAELGSGAPSRVVLDGARAAGPS